MEKKILYALQATGNGHIARANVLVPLLRERAQVDVFVSGQNAQLSLDFEVQSHPGISLFYSYTGGLNYKKIVRKNSFSGFVKSFRNFPIEDYDLIINDYEPVTAYAAKYKSHKIIGLSHQAAVLHPQAPRPNQSARHKISEVIMRHYAPVPEALGFHFQKYDDRVFYPILRENIRNLEPSNEGYCLVYLPGFHDDVLFDVLSKIGEMEWYIFSPFTQVQYTRGNCTFQPISKDTFMEKLSAAQGVLCGAGFEFPAEVLFLKKMLFVIPIKGQYEQYCNYLALKQLGVEGAEDLNQEKLKMWLSRGKILDVNFEDETESLVETILHI